MGKRLTATITKNSSIIKTPRGSTHRESEANLKKEVHVSDMI